MKFSIQVQQTLIIPGDGTALGIMEPQELKGLLPAERGTVRSKG